MACGRFHSAASTWPVWPLSSSIACLPRITSSGCSRSISFRSARAATSGSITPSACTCSARSAPIASARAQLLLAVGRSDRGDHHFLGAAALLDAQRLLEGDLVEGIDAHLHAVGDDAAAVGLDPDAHVVVHDALDADQDALHDGSIAGRPGRG